MISIVGFLLFACAVMVLWNYLTTPSGSFFPNKSKSDDYVRKDLLNSPYEGPEDWQCDGRSFGVFQYARESTSSVPSSEDLVIGRRFAVLDFETTGINPIHKHRVIEIGLTLFSASGDVEDAFCTLINPNMKIDNTIYHGITSEMVQHAPTMKEVLPYIVSLLNARIVVAHNAPFEEMFLFHLA